ncbi:hypothetical protein ACFQ0K_12040 [Nocardioides caeni]|uniref:Tat pathway signal sequence domain protein n=1 Tax=Nocardioides caeni TaxID=574700 RepID=A0A4S8NLG0_9ACTN|nr:hypothetical protein [Nocardioides caeni]THV17830.1 hypothetical protein E9934_05030 [Nocardioides caeni]
MTAISMRRRLATGIASAFVAATALVATSAGTAHAGVTACATSVTLKASYKTNEFRGYNSLTADTTSSGAGCTDPYVGNTVIQRWTGSAWVNVAMNSSGGSYAYYYGADKFNATTTYRAVYGGGANSSYSWSGSASASLRVNVIRKVAVADRSTRRASAALFTIKPAASIKGKRALFQVRKGGAWRTYKRVTVPSTGRFVTTFANSRTGIKYRMILPAGSGFAKSVHGPFTATRR